MGGGVWFFVVFFGGGGSIGKQRWLICSLIDWDISECSRPIKKRSWPPYPIRQQSWQLFSSVRYVALLASLAEWGTRICLRAFSNENRIECLFRLRNLVMCDDQENVTTRKTDRQTDRQMRDKVIPMCRYASQATVAPWTSCLTSLGPYTLLCKVKFQNWPKWGCQADGRRSKWLTCGQLELLYNLAKTLWI